MLKKAIVGISIILSGFMLAACGSVDNLSSDTNSSSGSKEKNSVNGSDKQ
ncbi:hypothetical protein [Lentilactobacillus kisonensis]